MEGPVLRSERLELKIPCEAVFKTYADFYSDEDASVFYGGPLTPVAAWKRLAADIGHWSLRGYGIWAIELLETNECVGGCGLYWPGGWPRPELTWWIIPSARRMGIAAEASRAVINWSYANGWKQVETHMCDENFPARKLVESLQGVKMARELFPDGNMRDVFSFTSSEDVRQSVTDGEH